MKITVFGAGATGGHFAAKLAGAGNRITVVARGAHLEAMRGSGLTLLAGEARHRVVVEATNDTAGIAPQDVVLVGVKATALPDAAEALRPLVGPDTLVVFPQNGMPWWYPVGLEGKPETPDLRDFSLIDRFLDYIGPEQLVGGSIYSANELVEPGVIRNNSPGHNRIDLGPVVRHGAAKLQQLRAACADAGIAAPECPDIRAVVWRKLLHNMSGSTIALIAATRSSVSRRDRELGALYKRVVAEGLAIAAAHGYDLSDEIDPDAMLARISEHRPSLLQDFEAGRPMEIEQIVIAPRAFARKAGIDAPVFETLAALAARIAADRGLYDPER